MQTCSIDFFSFYLFVVYTENFPQETVMHLKIQKENKQQNENPFFPFSCMPERHRIAIQFIYNFSYHLLKNIRTRKVWSPSGHNSMKQPLVNISAFYDLVPLFKISEKLKKYRQLIKV